MTIKSTDNEQLLGNALAEASLEDMGSIGVSSEASSSGTETINLLCTGKKDLDIYPDRWRSELRNEAYFIFARATPLLISSLLNNVTKVGTVFSLGRLGTEELAACALGGVFEACTAIAPFLGIITALETLCSQAHTGSQNKHVLGIYLQRAIVLQCVAFTPIICVWLYAEQILIAIGQNPEIAHLAAQYIVWSIPGVLSMVFSECVKRYLHAQGFMRASAYVAFFTAPVSLVLFYILVLNPSTSLGFVGALIAAGITNFLVLLFYVGYVVLVEGGQAWGGFSREAFHEWRSFMRLGFPGMVMVCSEVWAFEVISLASSYLGTIALASQAVIGTTLMLFGMVSTGITIVSCNRIGNLLGSGQPRRAALVAKVSLVMGTIVGALSCSIVWILRDTWGHLFNQNEQVVSFVSNILPVIAVILLSQAIAGVCNGILLGLGKQKVGALIKVGTYYLMALPIGLVSAFYGHLGLKGLWIGVMIAYIACFVLELVVVLRTDWNAEVRKCQRRIVV